MRQGATAGRMVGTLARTVALNVERVPIARELMNHLRLRTAQAGPGERAAQQAGEPQAPNRA